MWFSYTRVRARMQVIRPRSVGAFGAGRAGRHHGPAVSAARPVARQLRVGGQGIEESAVGEVGTFGDLVQVVVVVAGGDRVGRRVPDAVHQVGRVVDDVPSRIDVATACGGEPEEMDDLVREAGVRLADRHPTTERWTRFSLDGSQERDGDAVIAGFSATP